eukprot:gnl/MRDRNA2_/MRDRNA2_151850_c0_seq1.p1 gnl/MRDRNA2_/MRDRNA2_151850_c0~~gnl/MRDRNA2_/MRDRNA2_151850_c0_seq1.p1  ORF type:complete len:281 (+),score=64.76 gnl/MRDRNA2_/MRDRNA2_151850_c0_seq1:82-924(+)
MLLGDSAAPAPEIMEVFKLTAEAKIEEVCSYVEYLLENDQKFLIFAHHHVMMDALEQKVQSAKVKYIRIDGKTDSARRHQFVDQFQNNEDVRVAVLSITACGQGLTLTAAHTVVFAELYWVPGQHMQAEDRCHRIGQEQMVDVHYCIAEGTLDENMFKSLNRKAADTSGILDGMERGMDLTPGVQRSTPEAHGSNLGSVQSPEKELTSSSTPVAVIHSSESLETNPTKKRKSVGRSEKRALESAGTQSIAKFMKLKGSESAPLPQGYLFCQDVEFLPEEK